MGEGICLVGTVLCLREFTVKESFEELGKEMAGVLVIMSNLHILSSKVQICRNIETNVLLDGCVEVLELFI